MVKPMRTWDIAKLLISHCGSPEEVHGVIRALQDPTTVDQICFMLDPFVSDYRESGRYGQTGSNALADREMMTLPARPSDKPTSHSSGTPSANLAIADELASLFRTHGMTNRQVETWLADGFGVQLLVGKDSLRRYLARVLNSVDLGGRNRITVAARNLASDGDETTSEITQFWNDLDERFAGRHD